MLTDFTEQECLEAIKASQLFHATVANVMELRVDDYDFFICTAIHSGHQLREQLAENCLLSESERLFEEDPFTDEIIAPMPISVAALCSRYEFDLNRSPEKCIYEKAWGKQVWKQPLTARARQLSLQKHALFYRIMGALTAKIESLHGKCLIYDIHSYNYRRVGADAPTFNIGTHQLNTRRWDRVIDHWVKNLGKIKLSDIDVRSAENEVFSGKGYLATFVCKYHHNSLVLPTEIKKIFMDEDTGKIYPLVLNKLKSELKEAILASAIYFQSVTASEHSSSGGATDRAERP
ncbi:MAG: hypothetical protein CSA31_01730 [Desulfobulbus propionicus]|nr:MAG: hypothetical protein CSA31_01730 [Desulfobulbus propionicus]